MHNIKVLKKILVDIIPYSKLHLHTIIPVISIDKIIQRFQNWYIHWSFIVSHGGDNCTMMFIFDSVISITQKFSILRQSFLVPEINIETRLNLPYKCSRQLPEQSKSKTVMGSASRFYGILQFLPGRQMSIFCIRNPWQLYHLSSLLLFPLMFPLLCKSEYFAGVLE